MTEGSQFVETSETLRRMVPNSKIDSAPCAPAMTATPANNPARVDLIESGMEGTGA